MSGEAAYEAVTDYIENEIGFATSHYNDSYLKRRLSSRMRRTGVEGYDEYFDVQIGRASCRERV